MPNITANQLAKLRIVHFTKTQLGRELSRLLGESRWSDVRWYFEYQYRLSQYWYSNPQYSFRFNLKMEKGDLLWAVISQDWASVVDAGGQKRSHSVRWSFSPVFIRRGPFFPGLGNSEGSLEQDKSLSASLKGLWTKETRKKYNTQDEKTGW